MKLLFDENLSPKLVSLLDGIFEEVSHVRNLGLERADDSTIWNYARENGYTICSKDKDFADRSMVAGAPPKIVWLRLGNCSAQAVATLFIDSLETLSAFEVDSLASFCVLPPGLQI